MRVTRVVLEAPSYDPASGSARALKARDSFEQSEGYELELAGDLVLVSKDGHTAAFPMARVKFALVEREQADSKETFDLVRSGNEYVVARNGKGKRR